MLHSKVPIWPSVKASTLFCDGSLATLICLVLGGGNTSCRTFSPAMETLSRPVLSLSRCCRRSRGADLWHCNGANCFTSRRAITILSPETDFSLPHRINRAQGRKRNTSLSFGLSPGWRFYGAITCDCYAVRGSSR